MKTNNNPMLTRKSVEALERKFEPLVEGDSWQFEPKVYACDPFKGQNKKFRIAGLGEDRRVLAALFRTQEGEEAVIVLAINAREGGKARHAKFLSFRPRPSMPWWDENLTIAVQNI